MSKKLILLSLIFVPFIFKLAVLPLIPVIEGGTRPSKEFITLLFSFAIFLCALFSGELKPFKNRWILIFLLYIPVSIQHSPPFMVQFGKTNIAGMWQWMPFCKMLIYGFLIITVASLEFTKREIQNIFIAVSWVGLLMALYIYVQKMNIDQFFFVKPKEMIGNAMEPKLMGTMGNSTLVSAFLVMCLPFCLYLKKWLKTIIIIIAILLCRSDMAYAAMILCFLLYSLIFSPKSRAISLCLIVFAIVFSAVWMIRPPINIRPYIKDNGRFNQWKIIVNDIRSAPISQDINTPGLTREQKDYLKEQNKKVYAMTGIGLGSFKIIYSDKHKQIHYNSDGKFVKIEYPRWGDPHNEYITITYAIGLIGLGLFLAVVWSILYPAFLSIKYNSDIIPLFTSIVCVLFVAFGTFILQIEPPRFYTAIFAGLLLNKEVLNGKYICKKLWPV